MPAAVSRESSRLAALHSLNILHTKQEQVLDDITRLAAHVCEAPIALISLVADEYQWFKSCFGIELEGTDRKVSFCTHAIDRDDLSEPLVVSDATQDERFADNPVVTGEIGIRMYAGMPLVTSEGHAIGTLCVIDKQPRTLTPTQLDTLTVLARSVVNHFECRKAMIDLRVSEERLRLVYTNTSNALITLDEDRVITEFNARAEQLLGVAPEDAIGKPLSEVISFRFVDAQFLRDCPMIDPSQSIDFTNIVGREVELTLVGQFGRTLEVEITASAIKTNDGHINLLIMRDVAERRLAEARRQESAVRDVVVYAMARLAESRDSDTGAHIERVQKYSKALAEQMAKMGRHTSYIDAEFIDLIYATSPLHDIGKVGIPDEVLLKPGRLTPEEFAIMKTHTTIGAQTLEAAVAKFPQTRFLRLARNIAATHHERWDGSGYPAGLRGEEIPLCGRIVALADVYDALMSSRVYKQAFTHEIARETIVKESGRHFDPEIVEAFLAIESNFIAIYEANNNLPAPMAALAA